MKKHLRLILALGIPLFIISIVITVWALQSMSRQDDTAVADPPSAQSVMDGAKESGAIPVLSDAYTLGVDDNAVNVGTLFYKKENTYATSLAAQASLSFIQSDTQATTNNGSALAGLDDYLKAKQLSRADDRAISQLYRIYENRVTTCQVTDLPKVGAASGTVIGLVCLDTTAITEHYEKVDTLLRLYADTEKTTITPSTVYDVSISENNKTLTTLNLYGVRNENSAIALLFGALDGTWEYLGSRALSNGENAVDSSLSASVLTKIADPKYNGFLEKQLIPQS